MEIEILAICDFAQNVGGKLTIIGTFDTIHTSGLPAMLQTCWIAARIRFPNNEAGEHSFKIAILDSSNKEIIPPFRKKINVKIPNGNDWGFATIVMGIGQLTLPSYGKHFVNLSFDDKQIKTLTFVVKKLTSKEN